jgi:uncharacterized membrane protein YkvA (DUF1232 family)
LAASEAVELRKWPEASPMRELLMRSAEQWIQQAKNWAHSVKRDVVALRLAARDRRTPWYAKLAAACVAAYALSPIDLIPDFIPVFGYLDDLLLVPLGILLVVRLIPASLMDEFRAAALTREERPVSLLAAAVIVLAWLVVAAVGAAMIWRAPL